MFSELKVRCLFEPFNLLILPWLSRHLYCMSCCERLIMTQMFVCCPRETLKCASIRSRGSLTKQQNVGEGTDWPLRQIDPFVHLTPCPIACPKTCFPKYMSLTFPLSNLSRLLVFLYSRALAAGRRCLHQRRFILRIPLFPLSSLLSFAWRDGFIARPADWASLSPARPFSQRVKHWFVNGGRHSGPCVECSGPLLLLCVHTHTPTPPRLTANMKATELKGFKSTAGVESVSIYPCCLSSLIKLILFIYLHTALEN